MRFIDADSICVFGKYIKTNEKFEPYIMIDDLVKLLDEQPTAYDVDEVVKELEEKARTVNVIGYGTIYEAINKDVAIEIVQQVGVETETETIRDKAVKWNNNSSKRVPYEFIDYVEGKREICVSDDVCEWKYNYAE